MGDGGCLDSKLSKFCEQVNHTAAKERTKSAEDLPYNYSQRR